MSPESWHSPHPPRDPCTVDVNCRLAVGALASEHSRYREALEQPTRSANLEAESC